MDAKRVNKENTAMQRLWISSTRVANLYISTVPRDYGTGEEYTSVEVHTLEAHCGQSGNYGDRTGQAQRQDKGYFPDFKKIEDKGLICRGESKGENKYVVVPDGKRKESGPGTSAV